MAHQMQKRGAREGRAPQRKSDALAAALSGNALRSEQERLKGETARAFGRRGACFISRAQNCRCFGG